MEELVPIYLVLELFDLVLRLYKGWQEEGGDEEAVEEVEVAQEVEEQHMVEEGVSLEVVQEVVGEAVNNRTDMPNGYKHNNKVTNKLNTEVRWLFLVSIKLLRNVRDTLKHKQRNILRYLVLVTKGV